MHGFLVYLGACLAVPAPSSVMEAGIGGAVDEEFDRRLEAAGEDVQALWELVVWCDDTDREKSVGRVLRTIVRLQPDHRRARRRLGHVLHEGRWFTTQKKLEAHLQGLAAARAREQGLVSYRGEWVSPRDLPFLKRGLLRGPLGRWITPAEQRKLESGWQLQDLEWIPPSDVPRVEQGLWKCDDRWLTAAEADRWHGDLPRSWVVPSPHLTVWSTCRRATILGAIEAMESGYRELGRLYGSAPAEPLPVVLLRRAQELKALCFEGIDGFPPADGRQLTVQIRSVFAESRLVAEKRRKKWLGSGTAFWDTRTDAGDQRGLHNARMAMGLSFADAMDPSAKAVAKADRKGIYEGFVQDFYGEKRHPAWFRWGAACYASRYYEDSVSRGGDPWWTRRWSVGEIERLGGMTFLRPAFELDPAQAGSDCHRLVLTCGLLVAFVLDGGCAPVEAVHGELQAALRAARDPELIFQRLRTEIEDHEPELRAFASQ